TALLPVRKPLQADALYCGRSRAGLEDRGHADAHPALLERQQLPLNERLRRPAHPDHEQVGVAREGALQHFLVEPRPKLGLTVERELPLYPCASRRSHSSTPLG